MPIRTDLNAAFRPTPQSSSTPAAPEAPAPTVDELIGKAVDGTLTPTEASQLAQLLDSPELKSAFTDQQKKDLQKFAEGKGGPPREASELHSDLKLVKNAKELPARFAADLVLAHQALLEHAALLRSDKATRLFEFVVPYAKALADMAQSPQELRGLAKELLAQADKAGFRALERQSDGKNGLEVLASLLKAGTAEDMARLAQGLKFDAPSWAKDPPPASDREHLQAIAGAKAGEQAVLKPLPGVMQPPVPIQRKADTERTHANDGNTNKKLGSHMIWNVLHRFRDSGENDTESAAQREAMTQLAWVAGLILVFFAIVVVVLVAL